MMYSNGLVHVDELKAHVLEPANGFGVMYADHVGEGLIPRFLKYGGEQGLYALLNCDGMVRGLWRGKIPDQPVVICELPDAAYGNGLIV